jgi:hypothetical protein
MAWLWMKISWLEDSHPKHEGHVPLDRLSVELGLPLRQWRRHLP